MSNADIGKTLAAILKLNVPQKSNLTGRIISEAMTGGERPQSSKETLVSAPATNGLRTVLNYQQVGTVRYFDAGAVVGRTAGLDDGLPTGHR